MFTKLVKQFILEAKTTVTNKERQLRLNIMVSGDNSSHFVAYAALFINCLSIIDACKFVDDSSTFSNAVVKTTIRLRFVGRSTA